MLTLALTGTVPLTVDPEAGDVTVTIRLPSCANASCGAIQLQRINVNSAAARASLLIIPPRRSCWMSDQGRRTALTAW